MRIVLPVCSLDQIPSVRVPGNRCTINGVRCTRKMVAVCMGNKHVRYLLRPDAYALESGEHAIGTCQPITLCSFLALFGSRILYSGVDHDRCVANPNEDDI